MIAFLKKMNWMQWIGLVVTLTIVVSFAVKPNFPTPDKMLFFLTFAAMIFGKAKETLKRFLPFVVLLFAYESFRGFADQLNTRVNFNFMIRADQIIGLGKLPTNRLQQWLWHGHVTVIDFIFYVPYLLHFVLPFVLAVLVWRYHEKQYWRVIGTYLVTSFAGFFTFLLFPAAPPWMASDLNFIPHVERISTSVWYALGIHDFSVTYSKISPNPVAAMPSLHAAYATILGLFAVRLFKSRWKYIALIYPFLIYVGTVYQGEHYAIDEIVGALYAVVAYFATPYILRFIKRSYHRIHPVK